MNKITKFIYYSIVAVSFLIISNKIAVHAGSEADKSSKVLLKGDGFTITQMDVDVESSFLSPQFQTNEAEKINAILRNRLFALEAKKKWNDPVINKKIELMTEKYYGLLYNDKIEKSIEVGDDVLKSYYIANEQEFITKAEYNINVLVVKHKLICDKIKKDIESKAKDFASAVQESSIDQETKEKNGSMGWTAENNLPQEMLDYIAPLEKGQISEPFIYDGNWILAQVADKKNGEKKDFEASKSIIRQKLIQKKYLEEINNEFDRLKKEFNVPSN